MSYYPCKPTALQLADQQESRVNSGEPMTFQHLLCFSPGLATVSWHKQVAVMLTALEIKPKVNRTVAERWNGSILWLFCTHVIESGESRTYYLVNVDLYWSVSTRTCM